MSALRFHTGRSLARMLAFVCDCRLTCAGSRPGGLLEARGRDRDVERLDYAPVLSEGGAPSRRALHRDGASRRVRRDDVPPRDSVRDRAGRRSAVEGSEEKSALYGTGGLKLLPDETSSLRHLAGAVSSVMLVDPAGAPIPGSSGTQFFICDSWQQQLDGKFSVFARVTDGMDVVRQMSALPRIGDRIEERIVITKVSIRPVGPPAEEIGTLRARIDTTAGEIVWDFLPTAPENARNFIRLARSGYYDGATIYRAISGLLIQGASAEGWPQDSPNRKRSFSIWNVPDEFTATVPFERGVVGMAHGGDADSANVHFFVLVSRAAHLDGKYTPFAKVVSGMDVAEAMSKQPAVNEKLSAPVTIRKVTIEKR
ncbi:MAG: peptidylprolyl isomerase [Blastocatellia bacterium]|nr:peptidylprolyl isomerase [Blastocatellia bacterium]